MELATFEEALRAHYLAVNLCNYARPGMGVVIGPDDIELAALGLFLVVLMSGHSERVADVVVNLG